jgi:hypothetical protein
MQSRPWPLPYPCQPTMDIRHEEEMNLCGFQQLRFWDSLLLQGCTSCADSTHKTFRSETYP